SEERPPGARVQPQERVPRQRDRYARLAEDDVDSIDRRVRDSCFGDGSRDHPFDCAESTVGERRACFVGGWGADGRWVGARGAWGVLRGGWWWGSVRVRRLPKADAVSLHSGSSIPSGGDHAGFRSSPGSFVRFSAAPPFTGIT